MGAMILPTASNECLLSWDQRILLGGFSPSSVIDWPGRRAATIYLSGCPWRCPYCHNPVLQRRQRSASLVWSNIADTLLAQRDALEGVVFSGGEPTADGALPEAVSAIRKLGLPVGLHTSGAYPERLARVLPLLDWVGFDLKADYDTYDVLTGARGSAGRATRSARLVIESGVAHEFRLTWHPEVLDESAAILAVHFARHLGARRFVLQQYRSEGVAQDAGLGVQAQIPERLAEQVRKLFADSEIRAEICGLLPAETSSVRKSACR